jgi:hypothetical protein
MGNGFARTIKYAVYIGLLDVVPILDTDLGNITLCKNSGVVDQHVQLAEFFNGKFDEALDLLIIGYVGLLSCGTVLR